MVGRFTNGFLGQKSSVSELSRNRPQVVKTSCMNLPLTLTKFFVPLILRLSVKTASLPKFSNSRSKNSFHLLLFSLSRYFFIHMAFKDLLKDVICIILRPPLLKSPTIVSLLILSPFPFQRKVYDSA